jgi:hypothetical protein
MWIQEALEKYEYVRKLSRIVVYLDDIDDVKIYLEKHCENVCLSAGKATTHDSDDLLSATRKEVWQLCICATKPDVDVAIGVLGAYVGTRDRTKRAADLVDDVYSLLEDRRNPFAWPIFVTVPPVLMLIYWIVAYRSILSEGAFAATTGPIFYSLMTFLPIGFVAHAALQVGNAIVIRRRRRDVLTGRWSLRREVLVGIFIAVASGILTAIFTQHLGK